MYVQDIYLQDKCITNLVLVNFDDNIFDVEKCSSTIELFNYDINLQASLVW